IEQLRYAVDTLGLRGVKLGPVYQHWDPQDPKYWPLLAECQRLGIPALFHQGTTFPSQAKLRWGNPLQLEDLALEFPDLRIIIAHLGHPWEEDTVALVRKAPNVWADISAVHYRPWRYWQAMATAMEYGVTHKLLLASDFPSATITNVINGLRSINRVVEGTQLPKISAEIQERIISDNWRAFFTEAELK
ncbi:MAG: amidohydrolase family protein, partial [Chloroflexi bacterium]|nr:amidohydrolase family protein [Chloroflexota bacterium]